MNPIPFALLLTATVATGPQVTHIFSTPGPKTVSLTVCNAGGCSTATRTLTVLDPKPVISALEVPLLVGSAQSSVTFSASMTGRPPLSSSWTVSGPLATSSLVGSSTTWFPDSLGSHLVRLRASNASGLAFGGPIAVAVVPSSFSDLPPTHWAWDSVEVLAAHGITRGCGPLAFCPETEVTRDHMAVFLIRATRGADFEPPPATGLFADVGPNAWGAPFIEQLYREGLTHGCATSPRLYCPFAPVTRDQMAIFLLRAKYGPAYSPPPATGTVFADVPANSFAAEWIEKLAAEGITNGCATNLYCPGSPVTRAQMAAFLVRTFSLTQRPTPTLFRAATCEQQTCSFPTGLPLFFSLQVTGGLPTAYDYDWAGDGFFEQSSPYPVEFHTYSFSGTYSPRVRLRADAWSATLSHPPILIRPFDPALAPSVPNNLSAAYVGTFAPTPLDSPGTLWRTAFALRGQSQRHNGFILFRAAGGGPYRPVAVLPADLSRPLLLPLTPPGSASNIYLVAFNSDSFSPASPVLTVTVP